MSPRGAPGEPKSPEHRAKIGAGVKKARAVARAKLKTYERHWRGLDDDLKWLLEANASPEGVDVEQVSTILVSALEQIAEGLRLTSAVYEVARTTGVGGRQIPDPPSNGKGRPFERLSMDKLGQWKSAGVITSEAHDAEIAARNPKPPIEPRRVPEPLLGGGGALGGGGVLGGHIQCGAPRCNRLVVLGENRDGYCPEHRPAKPRAYIGGPTGTTPVNLDEQLRWAEEEYGKARKRFENAEATLASLRTQIESFDEQHRKDDDD